QQGHVVGQPDFVEADLDRPAHVILQPAFRVPAPLVVGVVVNPDGCRQGSDTPLSFSDGGLPAPPAPRPAASPAPAAAPADGTADPPLRTGVRAGCGFSPR